MRNVSDQELESFSDNCESDLVERKQSFKGETPKKARETVCAFSNDLPNHNRPGILFIGANDNGTPSNEPITDELLRKLADIGPNLGAINRSVLIATDYVVIPLGADLFSLQGLKNLGPALRNWHNSWQSGAQN